jgi:hypothetical protein
MDENVGPTDSLSASTGLLKLKNFVFEISFD